MKFHAKRKRHTTVYSAGYHLVVTNLQPKIHSMFMFNTHLFIHVFAIVKCFYSTVDKGYSTSVMSKLIGGYMYKGKTMFVNPTLDFIFRKKYCLNHKGYPHDSDMIQFFRVVYKLSYA